MNPLHPMGLGELIDRSVDFWRKHWKPLFQLTVGFQLVQFIIISAAQALGRWWFPLASDEAALKEAPVVALLQMTGLVALMMLGLAGGLLVSQVASVAVAHFSFARITGQASPSPGEAFRFAATRLGATLGTFFLSGIMGVLVLLVLLLPSVALGVAAKWALSSGSSATLALGALALLAALGAWVAAMLWFTLRFLLASQVVALEPLTAMGVVRRAGALSSGRIDKGLGGLVKLRLGVLIAIMGAIMLIVSAAASLPLMLAALAYGAGLRDMDVVMPALVRVPLQLLQVLLGSWVAPLYVVFQTLFYADMRVRREGLDLELALGAPHP